MDELIKGFVMSVVVALAIAFIPWGCLTAINVVFGTSYVVTAKTWFAVWFLIVLLR